MTRTVATSTMLQLSYVQPQPEYRQATNEEGTYEYIAGWRAAGTAPHTETTPGLPDLHGTAYYAHRKLCNTEATAQALCDRIQAAGLVINPAHWTLLSVDTRTWDDIEREWDGLADRERLGLPL